MSNVSPEKDAKAQLKAAKAYAKATKPWYKKWWVWGIAVIVLIIVWPKGGTAPTTAAPAGATSPAAAASQPATQPASEKPAAQPDTKVKVGTAVKAGDLSYTVTDFTTTKKLSSALGNKAGNWVVVSVKIDNQGKDAVYITSGDFLLIEGDGTEYSTDTDAFMYLKTEENLLLEKLNPKLSQTGKLLFAVPEGITGQGMTFRATNGFINRAEILLEK